MASLKLLSLILTLSVISAAAQPPESPAPPQSLVLAAETLENSGYTAMSLTLKLIAPTLPLPSATTITAVTIFAPPNAAFSASGQPSLAHLLLHFSPLSLSPSSLSSLPFSSTIPSLSPSKHLTVTSSDPKIISINNVKVSEYPIYDDGFVIVYAIDNFFDLNFTLARNSTKIDAKLGFQCLKLERVSQFDDASGVLKSRGYSIFASFLDLQLMGFLDLKKSSEDNGMKWTVFAPVDEELVPFSGDFLGYSSLFMRHLVPCRVTWGDLNEMGNGTMVSISVDGFNLGITKDEDDGILMVNGVEIMFPDMYNSDWLVIHGIRGVIPLPEEEMELLEKLPVTKVEDSTASDRAEF
ncbi:hypothetical protein BUALT_Bualt05G0114300 [Buddleja alternifolia]|uniref:FAS1 domain-containing protein n=1 Tax=Buddleja alternifolia TaxID=168488 RepID=A0AAV6XJW7_9LAMI|nr:hypothetical protein BUALT_Bualt05G0114300 [Buddleja alternifolia]